MIDYFWKIRNSVVKHGIPFSFWSFSLSLLVMMKVRYACNHWIFLSGTSFHLHWFGATGNCSLLRFCLSLFCSFSPWSFFPFFLFALSHSAKSQIAAVFTVESKTKDSVFQGFPHKIFLFLVFSQVFFETLSLYLTLDKFTKYIEFFE